MDLSRIFNDKTHPYYVVAPPFTEKSSGIRVLHYLCHMLNLKGYEAYISTDRTDPQLRTPLLTEVVKAQHIESGRVPIVVYPEVVYGNPLNAEKVIRYVLNRPGFLGGDKEYDPGEFILQYRKEFTPEGLDIDAELFMPPVDTSIFNTEGVDESERSGSCVYLGRYRGGTDEIPEDSLEISFKNSRSLTELAEIYKTKSLIYTYETTAAALEASLCGCAVVYIPNESMLKEHPHKTAMGIDGSAWGCGEADIENAKKTVALVKGHYNDLIDGYWAELDVFIGLSQSYASSDRSVSTGMASRKEELHSKSDVAVVVDVAKATGLSIYSLVTSLEHNEKLEFPCAQDKENLYAGLATRLIDFNQDKTLFGKEHVSKDVFRKNNIQARKVSRHLSVFSKNKMFATTLQSEVFNSLQNDRYQDWIKAHRIQEVDAHLFAERLMYQWKKKTVFHFVLFLMPGEESLLGDTLDSLAGQMYDGWRLTVVSETPAPDALWQDVPVLKWLHCDVNDDPYELANHALQAVSSDWVSMIQPGTQYPPHALLRFGDYVQLKPDWKAIYTDTDSIDIEGLRSDPRFLPDCNLDLMRSMGYCRLGALVDTQWLVSQGGLAPFPSAEMLDAVFRVSENIGEAAIGHISDVLVHMPKEGERPLSDSLLAQVVKQHLDRSEVDAEITNGYVDGALRLNYRYNEDQNVSIILPNKNKFEYIKECVESIINATEYSNYELVIVDRGSDDVDTLGFYESLDNDEKYHHVKLLRLESEASVAEACNQGAAFAKGETLVFVRHFILVKQSGWLARLVQQIQRPEVGIAGGRLIYPETGYVSHAGYILGLDDVVGEPFSRDLTLFGHGYMNRAVVEQSLSAVNGACLAVDAALFRNVGGMNVQHLEDTFIDVDLCLRVQASGKKIVWTPYSILVSHTGTAGIQGRDETTELLKNNKAFHKAREYMLDQWMDILKKDPAYNINLDMTQKDAFLVNSDLPQNWDVEFHDRTRLLGLPVVGGSGEYRVCHPFQALSEAALAQAEYFRLNEKLVFKLSAVEVNRVAPDVVVVQASIQDMQINLLKDLKKFMPELTIVFTLDDLITDVPEKSSVYARNKKHLRNSRARLRKALSYCDRMIVTTDSLRDEYSSMIDDIRVVPNRLQKDVWLPLKSQRNTAEKPRVGWVGAQQHGGDLELIIEVVKQTSHLVDWVFMGMCPEEIRDMVKEYHSEWVAFDQYPAKVASLNLDIAVAPLEDHAFNCSKSNLRLLEYGVFAWPVICSDVSPYRSHGAPVKRVDNTAQAWIDALMGYVNNMEQAYRDGDRLQRWVLEHFILEDHLEDWQSALTPVELKKVTAAVPKKSPRLVNAL